MLGARSHHSVSDNTLVGGQPWDPLKERAMEASYFSNTEYDILLSDETLINGETWQDLKTMAMKIGYKTSTHYDELVSGHKDLVDELITAQI